ncbi:MAG TPA: response regulator transcription factor [Tepidisphaeraceae bacterium]
MGVTILFADDHRMTRESLAMVLEQQPDFTVVAQTGDGRAAVQLAAELSPDVAIVDVTMPGLNGIEATRQMKAHNPALHVIVLSMHLERQFVAETLAAGASAYLLKDCPVDDLAHAVRAVIRGETFLSPKVQDVLVRSYLDTSGPPAAASALQALSPREREIMQLVAEGKSTKEIARLLGLSGKTVDGHRRQIMVKLKFDSVADLTRYAIREGVATLS